MVNEEEEETVIFASDRLKGDEDVYFAVSMCTEGDAVSISI